MDSISEYHVFVMPLANDDIIGITDYIMNELQAPDSATQQMKRIKTAILTLSDYPYRIPLVRDPILARKGYHALLVDNYMIFFTIHESAKTVIVMRVVYARRDYKNLL